MVLAISRSNAAAARRRAASTSRAEARLHHLCARSCQPADLSEVQVGRETSAGRAAATWQARTLRGGKDMTELTRRRAPESHQETWHIFLRDVQVGTIGKRAGVPVDVDQWAGAAASIRPLISVMSAVRPRPSTTPAPRSKPPGGRICRDVRRPISRSGAGSAPSSSGNTPCGMPVADCRRKLWKGGLIAFAAPRSKLGTWRSISTLAT
jgi:hypothetical protein